jgi:uncharacterized metal-binding protein YceD (DUF177 family)
MSGAWSHIIRIGEIPASGRTFKLSANDAGRAALARQLSLNRIGALEAKVFVKPWFDGVQLDGSWSADVEQACVVTLEPVESELSGSFRVRVVPASSKHAPAAADLTEIDPEADDPPDVIEGGAVDLAAYVTEYLALEIDPYPRKPGVEFEPPPPDPEDSPFAVLKLLKKDD